ncbi:MAG: hypothetical protein JWO06_2733 [Bacteroidota bacterium]|nr:hypothetical protein [Bacteroidota bacterium]
MKQQLTALLIMTTLLIQAAPTIPDFRDGKYYEANSETPYSGYFVRYDQNHTKQGEGKIKDGVMDDVWRFYYPNGELKSTLEYEDGVRLKTLNSFYETGEKESEFDENKQTFTTWYKSGKPRSLTNYLDGLKQGSSVEWYENGNVKSDYTYYTHHEHGICKEYYENGQVSLIAIYRDGKKSGFWQAFYPDGRLKYQGRYSEDFKTGRWITRNMEGKLNRQNF